MREVRCPVCGLTHPAKEPHLKATHPEFSQWRRRFFIRFVLFGSVGIPILIVVDYFSFQIPNNDLLAALVNLAYVVVMNLYLVGYPLKTREFKRQWNQEHGTSV